MSTASVQSPIAVVGIGALFPGPTAPDGFWRSILSGTDLISEVPASHWLAEDYYDPQVGKLGKTYGTRGGFVSDVPFDPMDNAIPPANLASTDTAQLLAMVVAQRVLADARLLDFRAVDRDRVSVILGLTSATELAASMAGSLQYPVWQRAMRQAGLDEATVARVRALTDASYAPWNENTFPGLLGNVVAGRIANRFGLGGTNCIVDAACASSLSALHMGLQELWLGQSDLVVTGGVDAMNDPFAFVCFSRTPALSATGDCRPFDAAADGTILGEGVGMVALRRLADAEKDGNRVYAVIRGIGASSDGRARSIYAPRAEGQALALRRAYEAAGYGPGTVELVEAHGTGTVAGDLTELDALGTVFRGSGRRGPPWVALGSVKSQIGHTKGAAGAASLIKATLALHHKVLPPTIKVRQPHARLEEDGTPFYVNTALRPWIRGENHPRRASVSSFGFGGSNFHVTLEEYRGTGPVPGLTRHLPAELMLFSAADRPALIRQLAAASDQVADGDLPSAARGGQDRFDPQAPVRLAVVVRTAEELRDAMARLQSGAAPGRLAPGTHLAEGAAAPGPIAFLFPGQGSQAVGMGAELALAFAAARAPWDALADSEDAALAGLVRTVFPPPAFTDAQRAAQDAALTATERAQPALAACSLGYLALLRSIGVTPAMLGGHSFGEVTALAAAGSLDEPALMEVAARRGALMASAARSVPGAMVAVAADPDRVRTMPGFAGTGLVVANHNAPDQVVVAGSKDAVASFMDAAAKEGLACHLLPVATAFHSPLVAQATEPFARFLDTVAVRPPRCPVFSNVTAAPHRTAAEIPALLSRQIAAPVRFAEQVLAMHEAGARIFVEVGPGSVLTGLVARILAGKPHAAVALDGRGSGAMVPFWSGLGQLAVLGVPLDLRPLWAGYDTQPPPAPKHSPATVAIRGSNYGKRYPLPGEGTGLPEPAPVPPVAAPPAVTAAVAPDPEPGRAAVPQTQDGAAIAEAIRDCHAAITAAQQAVLGAQDTLLRALAAAFGTSAAAAVELPVPPAPAIAQAERHVAPPPAAIERDGASEPVPAPFPPPAPPALPDPVAAPAPAGAGSLVLEIVARETGYPVEMLKPEMELEADLGIDSIKRVEILSAVQAAMPDLPEFDLREIGSLDTLGAIAERLGGASTAASPAAPPTVVPIPAAPALPPAVPVPAATGSLVLEIVARETGYPVEMLKPEMELEADLGIDSIKRVEILSAVQAAMPDLPEFDLREIGSLDTLGAIAERLAGGSTPVPREAGPGLLRLEPYLTSCRPDHSPPPPRLTAVLGGGAVGSSLAELLNRQGIPARVCDAVPPEADGLVLFAGPSAADPAVPAARAVAAARAFALAAAAGGLFIAVQDGAGDFGFAGRSDAEAWHGGMPGLVKTAAQEWPDARVKLVELPFAGREPEVVAAVLAGEVLRTGPDTEIGLPSGGGRATLGTRARPVAAAGGWPGLPDGAVLLVTGGARGVTAHCITALARTRRLRLALLGRSEPLEVPATLRGLAGPALRAALARYMRAAQPAEIAREAARLEAAAEIRDTLDRIRASGSEVSYHGVDLCDAAAVGTTVSAIRERWGRIDGLVHGAGQVADRAIAEKTEAELRRVFGPKVDGLRFLLEATAADPLRLLALFTSVAGRFGNAGQADYAMANEILARVARVEARRRGDACLVRAIDWGPWEGGMVTPALRRAFESRNVPLIGFEAGAEAFVREVGGGHAGPEHAEVVLVAGTDATALRSALF